MQLRSRFAAHSAPLLLLCASLLCLFVPTHGGIFPPPTINGTNTNIKMRAYSQLQFVSITKIDGVEQAFNADFFMLSTWAAPKHDPAVTWQDDLVALSDFYWQPQLDFINAIGGVTPLITDPLPLSFAEAPLFNVSELWNYTLPDDYIWCTLDQRYVGSFLTPVDMKKFPFDSQKVLIQIESYWDNTQVEIVFAEPAKINLENLFPPTMPEIIGWQSRKVETSSMDFYYAYNTRTYNRLTLTIWLNRQPDFFLDKIVTGCAMLVVMCIMLFLLTAEEADRFMGAMAIFAGLIAYLFVASQYTPVVPYQTALDKFLSLCFFEVLFMTGVHGFLFYMREREKIAEEQKSMREAAAAAAGEEFDGVEDAHADGEGQLSIKAGNEPNQDINAGVAAKSGRVADAMPGEVEMNTIASPSAAGAAATGSGAASGASGHEAAVADGADGAAAAGVTFASSSASSSSSIATPPPAEKTAAEIAAAEDEADMNDPSLDSATRAVRRFGRIVNRFTAALGSTLTKLELTKEASAKNDGGAVAAAAAAAAVAAIAASKSDDDDDDGPPIMGADGMMRPKPKGGKRGRKRARTQHRGPMGALAFMGGLVPFKVPDLSAWASSLTFVRKLDFAFMFAFSAIFIIATAIIFGIPMKEQQEV